MTDVKRICGLRYRVTKERQHEDDDSYVLDNGDQNKNKGCHSIRGVQMANHDAHYIPYIKDTITTNMMSVTLQTLGVFGLIYAMTFLI